VTSAGQGPFLERCAARNSQLRGQLERQGTLRVASGSLAEGDYRMDLHTDAGPADQEKTINQDYVVAWSGPQRGTPTGIDWAIAMADGVTAARYAEIAAELACWTALQTLLQQPANLTPGAAARGALHAAGGQLESVAAPLAEDPEETCPADEMLSNWKWVLKRGWLLQTTLSLAWCQQGDVHLAMIGDGGALLLPKGEPWQVLTAPQETSVVHALGPANPRPERMDLFQSLRLAAGQKLLICTDGVGRGIERLRSRGQLSLEACFEGAATQPARALIDDWLAQYPSEFSDNLTLALVTRQTGATAGLDR